MTSSEVLSSLEVVLAGICPAPKTLSAGRLIDMPVGADAFDKLLRHWAALPEGSRPRLRGITLSRGIPAQKQFLLDIGGRSPFLLVTVDAAWNGRTLTGIWPYAAWWEQELTCFERASWGDGAEKVEVEWRRA